MPLAKAYTVLGFQVLPRPLFDRAQVRTGTHVLRLELVHMYLG